jgi:hypothetical protein
MKNEPCLAFGENLESKPETIPMRYVAFLLVFLISTAMLADDAWKTKRCTEPADVVFKAADRAAAKHYKIELSDPERKIVRFKVGTTAWSYGYTVTLSIDPSPNNTSVVTASVEKKGGNVVSWGSGKSEILRVYSEIDNELARMKQAAQ